MLQGVDLVEGEIVDGFLLSALNKTVVVVDKFLQVRLTERGCHWPWLTVHDRFTCSPTPTLPRPRSKDLFQNCTSHFSLLAVFLVMKFFQS